MNWKVVALSATAGFWLFPQIVRAQTASPSETKAVDTAPASPSESPAEKAAEPVPSNLEKGDEPAPSQNAGAAASQDTAPANAADPSASQDTSPANTADPAAPANAAGPVAPANTADPAAPANTADPAAPANTAEPAKTVVDHLSSWKDVLKAIRVGPSVAVGVPHPLTGGVDIVYGDLVSLSVTGGRFGINVEETDLEIRNLEAALRWYPFGGSFFLGAAQGQQGIVGKRKVNLDVNSGGVALKVPTTLRLEIESSYLTPQIGWFARWDSGLTIGFDIGYQMPSGAKSELQTSFENVSAASEEAVRNSDEYRKNKKDVEDAAKAIGETGVPYITFLRIGWLF